MSKLYLKNKELLSIIVDPFYSRMIKVGTNKVCSSIKNDKNFNNLATHESIAN